MKGLDDPEAHIASYLADLCHTFPGITPWNVYDLRLRHYLILTANIDARREVARKA